MSQLCPLLPQQGPKVTARLPQLLLQLPQEQGQQHWEKATEIQICHILQRMKPFPPQAAFNAQHICRHLATPTQSLDETLREPHQAVMPALGTKCPANLGGDFLLVTENPEGGCSQSRTSLAKGVTVGPSLTA